MKKLVLFDCFTHFGGSAQITLRTIKEMQKHCEVLVLDGYGACEEYNEMLKCFEIANMVLLSGAKYYRIGGRSFLSRGCRALASGPEMFKLIGVLRKKIAEIQPDAIWTTSQKGLFCLSRATDGTVPIVWFAHGENTRPMWYNRRAWKRLSLVAGVSQSSFGRLRGSPYEPAVTEVIHNGLDVSEVQKLAASAPQNIPSGSGLRLFMPATLTENKNQTTAIKGLSQFVASGGNAQLWLAGDYAKGISEGYVRGLSELANRLKVADMVHFLGWRNDVPALIGQCDIVMLISYTEGFPIALLEAMCLGKPIIASRVGGIPEMIRDGIDGILINPNDSEGLAAAMNKLADPELREKMGQAGYERVRAEFDIKVTASKFLRALDKIC